MAWTSCRWQRDGTDIHIDLVRGKGGDCFAVRRGGAVLANDGEWEYEPMPSSRDDDFLRRCRYATLADAIFAYEKHGPA